MFEIVILVDLVNYCFIPGIMLHVHAYVIYKTFSRFTNAIEFVIRKKRPV